jgi:hypothetical protein
MPGSCPDPPARLQPFWAKVLIGGRPVIDFSAVRLSYNGGSQRDFAALYNYHAKLESAPPPDTKGINAYLYI